MFIYNLEDVAKKLKIDFEGITKQIQHNGVKGSAREDLLKDYLKKLLPEKYSISSGIIIDNNQKQSKQQDFIIHDAFNVQVFLRQNQIQFYLLKVFMQQLKLNLHLIILR